MSFARVTQPAIEPLTEPEVSAHLRLGRSNFEPAPDAPSVALANAGAGNVNNGVHRYRLTFVTADGETEGGAISAVVTVADLLTNGRVALTQLPLGGSAVIARRIYRTAANGADYFLVATIADNTTTSYADNVADAALGVGVPVNNTTGDPLLLAFIRAAREFVESHTHHALITQTWRLRLDRFPDSDAIVLPITPVQSITAFTYVDSTGNTVPFADYTLDRDHFPGRVVLNYGASWPAARRQLNAVTIEFVAGFGAAGADVPSAIQAAMKLLIGSWWENREAVNVGNIVNEMPFGTAALLAGYRRPAMEMA